MSKGLRGKKKRDSRGSTSSSDDLLPSEKSKVNREKASKPDRPALSKTTSTSKIGKSSGIKLRKDDAPTSPRRDRIKDTSSDRSGDRRLAKTTSTAKIDKSSIKSPKDAALSPSSRDRSDATRSRQADLQKLKEELDISEEDVDTLLKNLSKLDGSDDQEFDTSSEQITSKSTKEKLKALLSFGDSNPFFKGRRAQIRPILADLFGSLRSSFDNAYEIRRELYDLREKKLERLRLELKEALQNNSPKAAEALYSLLSSKNPVSKILLQNPEALGRIVKKLRNSENTHSKIEQIEGFLRQQGDPEMPLSPEVQKVFQQKKNDAIEEVFEELMQDPTDPKNAVLKTLFDELDCSREQLFATKAALYSIKEATLDELKSRLDRATDGDDRSASKLFELLADDNLISRVILKNPDAFKDLLDRLPNTEDTHENIEKLEKFLVAAQDNLKLGQTLEIPLTVSTHEASYKKKTEILEDVIETTISGSDKPGLRALKKIGKANYWKILIDGQVHQRNNKHFYDRSKGFMASMMKGLNRIVEDIDRPLDTGFVKELHQDATELVTNESVIPPGFPISSTNFQENGIKKTPNAWGVTKSYSEAGMRELQALRNELDALVRGGYFSEDAMRFADRDPNRVVQWKAGKDPAVLQATVEQLMDHVIQKAYREIQAARGDQDKVLGAIVDCCRGLGIIHPFKDANGRLFMFLVLNKMLMEQGMSPTVLRDQGLMVGKSKAKLIELIKAGQKYIQDGTPLLSPADENQDE